MLQLLVGIFFALNLYAQSTGTTPPFITITLPTAAAQKVIDMAFTSQFAVCASRKDNMNLIEVTNLLQLGTLKNNEVIPHCEQDAIMKCLINTGAANLMKQMSSEDFRSYVETRYNIDKKGSSEFVQFYSKLSAALKK